MHDKAHAKPTLAVFGDSLSDNGNLFKLAGIPGPPYWQGRSSNGPVYSERLADLLGANLLDYAFAAADASDASPTLFPDPTTGKPFPISLSHQIDAYIASLGGKAAADNTTAVVNIGSNDYDFFLFLNPTATPAEVGAEITAVVGSVAAAVARLEAVGVSRIALYTLPDFALTPNAVAEGPVVQAALHQIDIANNAGFRQIAAAAPNVRIVDLFQLTEAFAADPQAFGFAPNLALELLKLQAAGASAYAPNEVAFCDGEHPTAAAHGVIAAFSDATLTSDSVTLLDGSQTFVRGGPGSDFIFAPPLDPTSAGLSDDFTIFAGGGNDIVYAGNGDVTVHGGCGNDLLFAGSGNASLFGGEGTDVLETNSLGVNWLSGGDGADALIANRGGTNTLRGGEGADLIVLKESASLVNADGSFDFGAQSINGGEGRDTLRFIVNDQNAQAEAALIAEFHNVEAAFDAATHHGRVGAFAVDGLQVRGVERLELQVDSVSTDPNTPYLITHTLTLSDGSAPAPGAGLGRLLQSASNWNLVTV